MTLGFPCAQFANQEAAGNTEILNTLRYVRPGNGFIPAFDLTQKLAVNGAAADPIWVALKQACPAPQLEIADNLPLWLPITRDDVNWNFETILVTKQGMPYRRYGSVVDPALIEPDIVKLLAM